MSQITMSQIHPDILHFVSKTVSCEWFHDDVVDKYWLQFITGGRIDYVVNGEAFQVKEGDVVLIKPGSRRRCTTPGMSCVALTFFLPAGEDIELPLYFTYGRFEEFFLYFQELYVEWLKRDAGFLLKSQGMLLLILHKLLYEASLGKKNNHVEAMKHYIIQRFSEKLTVKMVADAVGLNAVYCGALFKKSEGCTISEFITRVRINRAIGLLERENNNIGEIAEATGFTDIYFFSNTFKKIVGIAPSMYRNQI